MDLKTESQLRTELARVWEMLDAERAAYATRIAAADKRFDQAQAAIALRVPRSGIPELDAMIRESRRLDMATAAMQAMIGNELDCTNAALAGRSRVVADALLAASGKEERKC
jgi:hypothetical protein